MSAASLRTRQASNNPNIIEGDIIIRAAKNGTMILFPALLNIATNEFGRMNRALWPAVASKVQGVRKEAILKKAG